MYPSRNRKRLLRIWLCQAALLAPGAFALPEDAQQTLTIQADSSEMFLDRGYFVYRGKPDQYATITQGSMAISGLEIIVERLDGAIAKVTATGAPARFQQQPELNQAVVYASGNTLVFDNVAQLFTADENAEFIQGGDKFNGYHIEYDLSTRSINATGHDGQPVNVFIAPRTDAPILPAPATED
jgi:lipopolysaccharide export system protein LptA